MSEDRRRVNRRTALVAGAGLVGALANLGSGLQKASAQRLGGRPAGGGTAGGGLVNWQAVESALGKKGEMQKGGVFAFSLGREDIKPTVRGVPITSDFALDMEADFLPTGPGTTMVMGEIPVLDAEAETVMSRLFAAGMTVSAFHNHRIAMSPQVWWVHFSGMGAATSLAAGLRQALPGSGSVFASGPSSSSSPINAAQLKSILGGDTKNSGNGVVEVMVDRTDQIFMNGMLIPSAMGVDEHFYFQPLSGGRVAAVGELALRAEEVPAVTRVIRQYQMDITALHNHMLTEQPRLFFLHTWAVGNAVQIARAHRAAINYANTERP